MSHSLFRRLSLATAACSLLCSTGWAASYTRPNESKELFRLEKIPLQVTNTKEISQLLTLLALREQDATPEELRTTAQLLALAMRLDPVNKDARETDKAFKQKKVQRITTIKELQAAQSKLRFYKQWLESPDAGSDANALALHLTDATKTLNPETINNTEVADWTGILPPIATPRSPNTIKPKTDMADEDNSHSNTTADEPTQKPTKVTKATQFNLKELTLKSPLKTDESEKYIDPVEDVTKYRIITRHEITPIKVNLSSHVGDKGFSIRFSPSLPWLSKDYQREAAQKKLTDPVITLLKAKHKKLPGNVATVNVGPGKYAQFNHQSITAPMAVMLEASLTNKPLRQDVHICAAIDSSGKIIQPINFWKSIGILRKSESGGRLIIAEKSSKLMSQLLVYEEPDFFTRWEVFTAKNLDQAMEVSQQTGPANVAEASILFQSIQKLTKKTSVTQLTVNRAVRKRLVEILKLCPNHLSASELLLQGSGKRPVRLSELALAHEIYPTLASIKKMLIDSRRRSRLPSSGKLKKSYAKLRDHIGPLEKRAPRSSNDLYENTVKLLNDYRRLITLSRRISSGSSDYSTLSNTSDELTSAMMKECTALQTQAKNIIVADQ